MARTLQEVPSAHREVRVLHQEERLQARLLNGAPGTPTYDQVAEWVGVDGANNTDTSLI